MPSNNAISASPEGVLRPLERRRHQRVGVNLLGRYMLQDRREFPCQSVDMSPGGLSLFAPVRGSIGDRVVVYLDVIGRVEGVIVRDTENGFALALNVPLTKREKLADQLTWLANRQALGIKEDRQHGRIVPRRARTVMRIEDGREYLVKIIDVSLSGCAVECDTQPPLGTPMTIGKTAGRIIRHFAGGVAIEFLRLIAAGSLDEDIEL